jgi:hypothetical protein
MPRFIERDDETTLAVCVADAGKGTVFGHPARGLGALWWHRYRVLALHGGRISS